MAKNITGKSVIFSLVIIFLSEPALALKLTHFGLVNKSSQILTAQASVNSKELLSIEFAGSDMSPTTILKPGDRLNVVINQKKPTAKREYEGSFTISENPAISKDPIQCVYKVFATGYDLSYEKTDSSHCPEVPSRSEIR